MVGGRYVAVIGPSEATPDDEWNRNLDVVARELAKGGGRAMR